MSLHVFVWGWPVIFMAKRGSEIFWGLKGAPKNVHNKYFFASGPPYKCLWKVPNVCQQLHHYPPLPGLLHHAFLSWNHDQTNYTKFWDSRTWSWQQCDPVTTILRNPFAGEMSCTGALWFFDVIDLVDLVMVDYIMMQHIDEYTGKLHVCHILRITVAYPTWYHGIICQSGERSMSGHLYTVAILV